MGADANPTNASPKRQDVLVKRLRRHADNLDINQAIRYDCAQAANEIKRLREELAMRHRSALEAQVPNRKEADQ